MNKPVDQIDVGDIDELIASKAPEGQQLEFKADLSGGGNNFATGHDSQEQIGAEAKKKILKEVVAFANAQGGTLLLGIKETPGKQRTAEAINPLPKCKELADRLKNVFFSCVEPRIPNLEAAGVPVDGDSGVVVIRVGRSRLAPHCSRVNASRDCYVRRADCSDPMTMWEIQDMTLNVSRGMKRFKKRLKERSKRFQQELTRLKTPEESFALRVTALPVGEEMLFDRVDHQHNIREDLLPDPPWREVRYKKGNNCFLLDSKLGLPSESWRPVLQGVRGEKYGIPVKYYYFGYQELYCDGLLEIGYVSCNKVPNGPLYVHPDWPLVLFANCIIWADHIRKKSSAPMAEYGIQVELLQQGRKARLVNFTEPKTVPILLALMQVNDESSQNQLDEQFPEITNITFPTYALRPEDAPEVSLKNFYHHYCDAFRLRKDEDMEFVIHER